MSEKKNSDTRRVSPSDKVWMLPVTAGLRKVEVKVKLDERTMIVFTRIGTRRLNGISDARESRRMRKKASLCVSVILATCQTRPFKMLLNKYVAGGI